MTEMHGVMVVIGGVVHTTHHTLVVTEEEDGQGCNAIDCNQKTTLLQLVNDMIAWDSIHGAVCPVGLNNE